VKLEFSKLNIWKLRDNTNGPLNGKKDWLIKVFLLVPAFIYNILSIKAMWIANIYD
jgi:hypothetical protein